MKKTKIKTSLRVFLFTTIFRVQTHDSAAVALMYLLSNTDGPIF